MPRHNPYDPTFSEETDDILNKIPLWISKSMIINCFVIGAIGLFILNMFNMDKRKNSSYVRIYPQIERLNFPYLGKIDSVFNLKNDFIRKGDTILKVIDLEMNKSEFIIANKDYNKIIFINPVNKGVVLEENVPIAIMLEGNIDYQILGKLQTEPSLNHFNVKVYNEQYAGTGTIVGKSNKNNLIYSLPVTDQLIGQFLFKDSVYMDIATKVDFLSSMLVIK